MKRIFLALILLSFMGCANISPRNQPKIDNQNGKIDEIRNNQNGVMAEIGKLKQDSEITNSKLKEVQTGLLNLNAAVSRNENSGVQILQGDGALIFIFSIIVIGMLLYSYRNRAMKSEKTSEILANEIAKFNDAGLNDNIIKAAMNSSSEKEVYHLLAKNLRKM